MSAGLSAALVSLTNRVLQVNRSRFFRQTGDLAAPQFSFDGVGDFSAAGHHVCELLKS